LISKEMLIEAGADRKSTSFQRYRAAIPVEQLRLARLWTKIYKQKWTTSLFVMAVSCQYRQVCILFLRSLLWRNG